jgi:hypothetical protein
MIRLPGNPFDKSAKWLKIVFDHGPQQSGIDLVIGVTQPISEIGQSSPMNPMLPRIWPQAGCGETLRL